MSPLEKREASFKKIEKEILKESTFTKGNNLSPDSHFTKNLDKRSNNQSSMGLLSEDESRNSKVHKNLIYYKLGGGMCNFESVIPKIQD